jgi:hypothetical protein
MLALALNTMRRGTQLETLLTPLFLTLAPITVPSIF